MSSSDPLHSPVDVSDFAYVVGIDVGSQAYVYTVCQPDKRPVVKPTKLVNGRVGFEQLDHDPRQLGVAPARILIGLEATSRYNENLYQFLKEQGYALCPARIRAKRTSSRSNAACGQKRITWMLVPSHACCEVSRRVRAMSPTN
jgi:transposase